MRLPAHTVNNLPSFAKDVFSQHGEDGLLEEIFRRGRIETGFFVELGAWDGVFLSNSHNLYQKGWGGVLIEADSARFAQLQHNISADRCVLVNKFATLDGQDSLENILLAAGTPRDFELLSIDIDSDDLALWQSLRSFRPKCVVIEFNPTIPMDVLYVNEPGEAQGNAPRSIFEFAVDIGYCLVAHTFCNLIFVRQDLALAWEILPLPYAALMEQERIRYFIGYDGTFFVCRPDGFSSPDLVDIPWSIGFFPQPVPKRFRQYNKFKRLRFIVSAWLGIMAGPRPAYAVAVILAKRLALKFKIRPR